MKILCLTSNDLDGPDYGAAIRARSVFRLLQQHGTVDLVLAGAHQFWDVNHPPACAGFNLKRLVKFELQSKISWRERWRHELDPRFLKQNWRVASAADQAWLRASLPEYDLVWIYGVVIANGFDLWRWPRSVLDIDDIPSSYYRSLQQRAVGWKDKLRWGRQILLWQRHEQTLAERFDTMCVCSEPDRKLLRPSAKIFTVPNGFTAPEKPPVYQPAPSPRLGFVGTFVYEPNRAGVRWFLEKVWPLILAKMPSAKLRLAGQLSDQGGWEKFPNVEPLGWVADTAGEMATWSLSIVPIHTGSGTRVKIAEAFSRKSPLVSTTLGAYGYEVTDGCELFLADTPAAFAEKCLRLIADAALAEKMTATAWEKFIRHWTWAAQAPRVAAVVENVLTAGKPR